MAHLSSVEIPSPQVAADRWTAFSVSVWAMRRPSAVRGIFC